MSKLSAAKIRAVKRPGLYGDGGTLFLRVTPTSKNWIQRLHIEGRRTDLGLGGWPLTSLSEAREKAFHNRKLARSGGNPLSDKRQQISPTFQEALEKVLAIHEPTWKDGGRTAKLWRGSLRDHAAELTHKQVAKIRAEDVLAVLEDLWHTKHEDSTEGQTENFSHLGLGRGQRIPDRQPLHGGCHRPSESRHSQRTLPDHSGPRRSVGAVYNPAQCGASIYEGCLCATGPHGDSFLGGPVSEVGRIRSQKRRVGNPGSPHENRQDLSDSIIPTRP